MTRLRPSGFAGQARGEQVLPLVRWWVLLALFYCVAGARLIDVCDLKVLRPARCPEQATWEKKSAALPRMTPAGRMTVERIGGGKIYTERFVNEEE